MGAFIFNGLLAILLGLLAVPTLLAGQNPKAQEMLSKLVPFQGIFGIIVLVWGLYKLIFDLLFNIGLFFGYTPVLGISFLLLSLVQVALGFLLGFGFISKMMSSNEAAKAKSEELRQKLAAFQGPLGIAAIVLGVWFIIYRVALFGY
ncbi:MAG: hypothetical protein JNK86_03265 [Alphaproteobacteria bacterium]|jgi:hypothetical protein|nr:hypothetical protein [Alphaproteobacteria bacterium]